MSKGKVENRLDRPWIHWRGDGFCPVPDGVSIDVVRRHGGMSSGVTPLGLVAFWKYKGAEEENSDDIIRYRVNEDVPAADLDFRIEVGSKTKTVSAPDLLRIAASHMEERAITYDTPEGERSMNKTIEAFNTITGHNLKESEGWLLYQILKDVRQWSRPGYHADSAEDGVAYSALKGEALAKGL